MMRVWTRVLDASPVHLSLLRIVVAGIILVSPELHRANALAADPARLVTSPEGLAALGPIAPGLARLLYPAALSSGVTALLGFWSRTSMALLTVSAGLLFSLSSREGAVLHDMHLFWMTALLAAAPCGEALALDAWGKPRRAPPPAVAIATAFARLFLGLVYLFPGLHKLGASGLGWCAPANVVAHMHAKWLQNGLVPSVRIDHVPWFCAVGAAFVIAFELSFWLLGQLSSRTRLVALGAGLLFHLTTAQLFFISFPSLWVCYVVLLPTALVERLDRREAASGLTPFSVRPVLVVGVVVVLAEIVQGVRGQTQGWPFACYPTFEHVQSATSPDLVVEVHGRDGDVRRLTGRERAVRSQADWGRVYRISGAYGDVPNEAAIRAHARQVIAPLPPHDIAEIVVRRAEVPTAPETWGSPPPPGGVVVARFTP